MSIKWSVKAEGYEDYSLALEALADDLPIDVQDALHSIGVEMKETSRAIVPVRTGYLRSTIHFRTRPWYIEFGAYAEYAIFVEYGTRFMSAQPFIEPTIRYYEPFMTGVLYYAVDTAARRNGL